MSSHTPNGTNKSFGSISRWFFNQRKADKTILRHGALSINMCTGVLSVHDGKTCGGIFHYCPCTPDGSPIAPALDMDDAPVLNDNCAVPCEPNEDVSDTSDDPDNAPVIGDL